MKVAEPGAGQRPVRPDAWAFATLLRGAWARLAGVLACLAIAAATEPAMVAVVKVTMDWGDARIPKPAWLSHAMLPAAILLLFAVRGAAAAGAAHWMGGVCADAVSALQRRTLRHLLRARQGAALRIPVGKPVHLLSFEIKQCADLLERITMKLVRHVLTLCALYVSLYLLNWKLTLVATLALPLVGAVCWALLGRLRRLTVRQIRLNEGLADSLIARSHKLALIKMHGTADAELRRFLSSADQLRRNNLGLYKASALAAPLTQVLAVMVVALIATWTMGAAAHGAMSKGEAIAYVTNLLLVLTPLKNLAELNGPVLRSIVGMQSVQALGDLPAAPEPAGAGRPLRGDIELDDVTVAHERAGAAVLQRFSLRIAAGEMVAVVGPSGAGKTTLFQVIRGILAPTAGAVRIDGLPVAAWPQADLARQIAVVSQQPQLFNRSILDNVAYGEHSPDIARAWRAVTDVGLGDAIAALPMGIDTHIGADGALLSGGQARLLSVARALYSEAPVILLDEPTASLDPVTEHRVRAALARVRRHRTIVMITHCPTLADSADRVVLLPGVGSAA